MGIRFRIVACLDHLCRATRSNTLHGLPRLRNCKTSIAGDRRSLRLRFDVRHGGKITKERSEIVEMIFFTEGSAQLVMRLTMNLAFDARAQEQD
jgi:hypothetical protein